MKKQLIFKTNDEFQQYISENNLEFNDLEIFQNIQEEIVEKEIELNFLSNSPKVTAKISSENILYVDDIKINENLCMPTKISFLGRDILINVCNENNISHANLNIKLDEKLLYSVPFEIRKKEDNNFLLEISNELI